MNFKLAIFGIISLLVFSSPGKRAEIFSGVVVSIWNGDTITVKRKHTGKEVKVRLYGVDCPEKDQPYGPEATRFLGNLAYWKQVTVVDLGDRSQNRIVGEVFLLSGRSINRALVWEGLAWLNERYSKDKVVRVLQEEAKASRKGLWKNPAPVPPWDWREGKRP